MLKERWTPEEPYATGLKTKHHELVSDLVSEPADSATESAVKVCEHLPGDEADRYSREERCVSREGKSALEAAKLEERFCIVAGDLNVSAGVLRVSENEDLLGRFICGMRKRVKSSHNLRWSKTCDFAIKKQIILLSAHGHAKLQTAARAELITLRFWQEAY